MRGTTTISRQPEMPGQRPGTGRRGRRDRSHRSRPWIFRSRPCAPGPGRCPLCVREYVPMAYAQPTNRRLRQTAAVGPAGPADDCFRSSEGITRLGMRLLEPAGSGPRIAHRTQPTVFCTACSGRKSR
jgi:hypothetical protein